MHMNLPALTLCLLGTVVVTQNLTDPSTSSNSNKLLPNGTSVAPTSAGLNITTSNITEMTDSTMTTENPSSITTKPADQGSPEGLSDGAIAGIAIGSIAGVAAVGGGVFGALKLTGRL
nr:CUGBP Elav-like family member 1 [Labrus bergylta]XP_020509551.1 CUGBP Elav-like family member 1 [Labrus bergylta]